MEAVILAGGLGSRLRHIVSDVPKPMAPVNGQPFLKYLFDYLIKNRVEHVILAVCYKAECIEEYFGSEYKGIKITYSTEHHPLGTGGAIKKALEYCHDSDVFILNGDTYFGVNLNKLKLFHENHKSKLTITVKSLINFERYGSVVIENDMIKEFIEKKPTKNGKINGGIYLLKKEVLDLISEKSFSFEKLVLESGIVDIYAYESHEYFIDIGVPNDFCRAQKDLKLI